MNASGQFVAQRVGQGQSDVRKSAKKKPLSREVMCKGPCGQLVAMSIPPGLDIGEETKEDIDQTLFLVARQGEALLDGDVTTVRRQDAVFVPAGTNRNLKNKGHGHLKLFMVYSRCRASFIF